MIRAVDSYFSQFQAFSTAAECEIQMGVDHRCADVVLIDREGIFAAIAECKRDRIVGYGPAQLKSYLCATDTRFGVFANSTNSDSWVFYENLRHNRFQQIDRSEFEEGIVKGIANREQLKNEIGHLKDKIMELENLRCELDTIVNQITQTKHNLTERTSNLTQQIEVLENYKSELPEEIHRKLDELLEEKMQRLESPLSELKIELQERGIVNWFKNLFSKEIK